jgi:hypothetical protein
MARILYQDQQPGSGALAGYVRTREAKPLITAPPRAAPISMPKSFFAASKSPARHRRQTPILRPGPLAMGMGLSFAHGESHQHAHAKYQKNRLPPLEGRETKRRRRAMQISSARLMMP